MPASQFGKLSQASFCPAVGLSNAHMQTIVPKFFIKNPCIRMKQERVATPDKDFVDLAWMMPTKPKALAVLFHGLEGSAQSHYIQQLVAQCQQENIACVVMHFRGCSGEPNLTAKAYHSGATFDPLFIIPLIKKRYSHLPLFAVGFSLGGNMLMKLMAHHPDLPIAGSIAVSAPLDLAASSGVINRGFSRVYQWHLLKSMKANVIAKYAIVDLHSILNLSISNIAKINTFKDFDGNITAPLHGYKDADDYYEKCSALNDLPLIQTPTLIIHAADDPFMNERVIPQPRLINPYVAYELSEYGGHVGFLSTLQGKHKTWLPGRITQFINEIL